MSKPDSTLPCRCGSGSYCRKHRRYGLRASIFVLRAYHAEDERLFGRLQRCGGGRRIMSKPLGGAAY